MAQTPEFLLPFQFLPGGSAIEIEQGSDTEIQQRVWCVLAYQLGQRADLPTFGLPEQTFIEGGANLDQIAEVITTWVPEATELISRDPNWIQSAIDTVTIRMSNA